MYADEELAYVINPWARCVCIIAICSNIN